MSDDISRATFRTPNGRSVEMWHREGTNDWNTLVSALNEDEYHLAGHEPVGTMVDVGGHIGSVGIGFAIDHPEAQVWIVEPLDANVEMLRRNIEANDVGARVMLIHAAAEKPGRKRTKVLWDFGDDESGHHHRFIGNASIATHSKRYQEHTVDCVSLPQLVKLAGGHIALLKIDCEGGEYAFFAKGAAGVGEIVGEFHDGRDRLASLLSDTHTLTITTGDDHLGEFRAVPL